MPSLSRSGLGGWVAWQELLAETYQLLRIVSSDGTSRRPQVAEHPRKRQLYITSCQVGITFSGTTVVPQRPRVTGKLRSGNLYQLIAYLRNRQATRPAKAQHDGILLYPQLGNEPLRADVRLEGFRMQVQTVDLNQEWRLIHEEMLDTIGIGRSNPRYDISFRRLDSNPLSVHCDESTTPLTPLIEWSCSSARPSPCPKDRHSYTSGL